MRPQDLDDIEPWPFAHILSVLDHIKEPETGIEGMITNYLVELFEF